MDSNLFATHHTKLAAFMICRGHRLKRVTHQNGTFFFHFPNDTALDVTLSDWRFGDCLANVRHYEDSKARLLDLIHGHDGAFETP